MRHRLQLALALGVFVIASVSPRDAAADGTYEAWAGADVHADIEDLIPRLHVGGDLRARRGEDGTELRIRPMIGARFSDWGILWLGYGWTPDFPDQGAKHQEHRFVQMLSGRWRANRLAIVMRARFAQRFVPSAEGVAARFAPLGRISYELGESGWSLIAWDELALGLNDTDWGAEAGFEQNRLFGGFGISTGTITQIELGYLNQWVPQPGPDGVAHVFRVSLGVELSAD